MKQKKQSKNYTAPALDKGLDILELLSENKEGLTQAEIANRLNKSVNEIYRMISTLRNREYVDFDEDEDRYNLSYKILNMTAKFEPVKTLISKAIPIMKEIAMKANQSIHLAIYTRGKILIIAQEDSPSSFNYHVSVGATFDLLETSSGRVILAFQTVEERQRRLERRKLFMKLQKKKYNSTYNVLEKKFSSKIIHEITKNKCEVVKSLQVNGVTNISVPVFDHTNQAIAAVTIPFLQRIKKDSLNDMSLINTTKLLKEQALILSKSLGFQS